MALDRFLRLQISVNNAVRFLAWLCVSTHKRNKCADEDGDGPMASIMKVFLMRKKESKGHNAKQRAKR
jgi:hypothetical protein